LIGRQLGQYHVVAELGRGQHAIVYRAYQPALERYVALKVLHRSDEVTRRKLQAEALLTADLIQRGATNIRQIYEVAQTPDGYLFVALEYAEDSLDCIMARARQQGKTISPAAAAVLLAPVADALDAVHRMGWAHLDLKPQNVLIRGPRRTLLADFGIARRRGLTTQACTPRYASPEQADGNRPVGPWSDIYSLGALLYHMVTGRPPFEADLDLAILNKHLTEDPVPPRRINRNLTPGQERALLKALSKSPGDRPASATALLAGLSRGASRVSPVIDISSDVLHRTAGRVRRIPRPLVVLLLVALILSILLLLGWALWPHLAAGGAASGAASHAV
jgi:serine/threonine-protein kinase